MLCPRIMRKATAKVQKNVETPYFLEERKRNIN